MTTEGEQKEAVCVTCKGRGTVAFILGDLVSNIGACSDCHGTGRILASVVPSDDLLCEVCGYPYLDGHAQTLNGPSPDHAFAPPTPSQDAEGDGLRPKCQLCGKRHGPDGGTDIARAWNAVVDHRRTVEHAVFSTLCSDVESAIREPYEALVQAARKGLLVLRVHKRIEERADAAEVGYDAEVFDEAIADLNAALTSIEESLGGRKDG